MPDIKHPSCDHPKCGAKMQRMYKRENSAFIPCGWLCVDCGLFRKDDLSRNPNKDQVRSANRTRKRTLKKAKKYIN